MRFDRIPSFLALTASIFPVLSFGRYTILEPIPADQRSLLNTAFDDAILLAAVAARPPLGRLSHGQRKRIYDKYFRKEDATTVQKIYDYIVGGNPHSGNESFANIAVDVNDKRGKCKEDPKGTINSSPTGVPGIGHFSVCQPFWWGLGRVEQKSCSQAGNVLSYGLEWPGTVILNALIYHVGRGAIDGQDIVDYAAVDAYGMEYKGPAQARRARGYHPEVTVRNVESYVWYAMELYWTVRCRFNFRDPMNQEENIAGSIYDPNHDPEHG